MIAAVREALIRLVVFLTNHLVAHVPSHGLRRRWYRAMGLSLGSGSSVHLNCYIWFYGPGQLRRIDARIGSNSIINRGTCLDLRGPITIGDNVSISPEVAIITTGHRWRDPGFPLEMRPVVIEDHAWIGMRAMILPGTRVGRGAVVAAGAVVSGDVAPMSVVAGVPARVVGQRDEAALEYRLDDLAPLFE